MLPDAVAFPIFVGVNVTGIVQLALGASDSPQVFVWLNSSASGPVIAMEPISRTAFPVLVSVTGCEILDPIACPLKLRLEGESETAGAPDVPVPTPVRGTVCGVPAALSAKLTAAVAVPVAVGEKVTLMVQLESGASEALHPLV